MTVFEAVKARRSVRKFKSTKVPDEMIKEMLESARLAPSPGNSQGHVFGVIRNEILKQKLAEVAGGQSWIATAPVVFACCGRLDNDIAELSEDDFSLRVNHLRFGESFIDFMKNYPDGRSRTKLFRNSAPLIPAEHIFLTAVSHGLSACFIGYLDVDKASDILKLPEHLACLYLLPVGYADEEPIPKMLKPIEEMTFYDYYEDVTSRLD